MSSEAGERGAARGNEERKEGDKGRGTEIIIIIPIKSLRERLKEPGRFSRALSHKLLPRAFAVQPL